MTISLPPSQHASRTGTLDCVQLCSAREGSDWILGKNSSHKGHSLLREVVESPPLAVFKSVDVSLGKMVCSGLRSAGSMLRFDDLKGLSQPKEPYDSTLCCSTHGLCHLPVLLNFLCTAHRYPAASRHRYAMKIHIVHVLTVWKSGNYHVIENRPEWSHKVKMFPILSHNDISLGCASFFWCKLMWLFKYINCSIFLNRTLMQVCNAS